MEAFNNIFEVIFKLSIYGTITAIILLAFKGIFRNKLSAKFHYFVWFILILRISIPFLPEAGTSFFKKEQIINTSSQTQNKEIENHFQEDLFFKENYNNIEVPFEHNTSLENIENKQINANKSFQFKNLLIILKNLYFPIVALIILYYLFGYTLLKIKSKKYKKCSDEKILKILNHCKKKLRINKDIKLLVDRENKSPIIFGIRKPKIVIPRNIVQDANLENLKYILLHELLHYKKKDLIVNWITNILNAVYWFNPIILYSLKQMKNDCENKTDEYVISNLSKNEQINYGKTILYMVANLSQNTNIIGSNTILGGKKQMKKRINNIINFKKPAMVSTILAIMLSIILGVFCFTNSLASSANLDISENTSSNITDVTNLNSNNSDVTNTKEENYSSKEVIEYLSDLQAKLPSSEALNKDSILKKMYNTGAYVASASGEYEINYRDGGSTEAKFDFKISNDNKILSYEASKDSISELARVQIFTLDEKMYNIDNNYKTYEKYNHPKIPDGDLLPRNPISSPQKINTDKKGVSYCGGVFSPIAGNSGHNIFAPSLYNGFLLMDSVWDVTGSENYLGFNCAIIKGTLDDGDYSEKVQTKNFTFWVDSATGALLKYEMYDKNGNSSGSLITKRLEINKPIPDSIFTADDIDLTGYSDISQVYISIPEEKEPSP